MYAVVTTGGKQVKVEKGDVIRVEKLDVEVGDTVELEHVSFLAKDKTTVIDPKKLEKAKVICSVTAQGRRKKIRVFKMKRRKNYRRTHGHRQSYTELKIEDIKG